MVLLMEKTLDSVSFEDPLYALTSACKLKGVFLQDRYLKHLEKFMLEDLADKRW